MIYYILPKISLLHPTQCSAKVKSQCTWQTQETVEKTSVQATPGVSRNDGAVITQLMREGRIFLEVRNGKISWGNLGTVRHFIPTIYSLRQDVIYIYISSPARWLYLTQALYRTLEALQMFNTWSYGAGLFGSEPKGWPNRNQVSAYTTYLVLDGLRGIIDGLARRVH